ncbi:MAG: hypothetical protein KGI33_12385 [Thaumarchaeota archaeon]|nr:hypothetical protein [Nitrososphaerota archaeon]
MKTLGVILIIIGLLMSVFGYGQYGNVECMCPAQIADCHCGDNLQQSIDHIVLYIGIAIVCSGTILFVLGWRKSQSLSMSEK